VQGAKGVRRVRRTLHNVSVEEAERAMTTFRDGVNRAPEPPPLIAPTFQESTTATSISSSRAFRHRPRRTIAWSPSGAS
jgi:hypothetical protein